MTQEPPKFKLKVGAIIMVVGFLSPLLIPLVIASSLSPSIKTVVSGLLAFGIPEVFMLLAVVVMGKQGYEYLKGKVGKYLKRFLPPDQVSRGRHYFGLVLFISPLLIGVLEPYLAHFIPLLKNLPLWSHISLDMIFIIGIFILGGDFWDKLRSLFQYEGKVKRES